MLQSHFNLKGVFHYAWNSDWNRHGTNTVTSMYCVPLC